MQHLTEMGVSTNKRGPTKKEKFSLTKHRLGTGRLPWWFPFGGEGGGGGGGLLASQVSELREKQTREWILTNQGSCTEWKIEK